MNIKPLLFSVIFFLLSCGTPSPEKNTLPEQPKCSSIEDGEEVITLRIEADGTFLLNGQKTTLETVGQCAATMKKRYPQIGATISGDPNVAHEKVIELMDVLKANGITKIILKTYEN